MGRAAQPIPGRRRIDRPEFELDGLRRPRPRRAWLADRRKLRPAGRLARVRPADGSPDRADGSPTICCSRAADGFRPEASGAIRERYGPTAVGQSLLLARRLVEAGVSLVTVNWQDETKIDG